MLRICSWHQTSLVYTLISKIYIMNDQQGGSEWTDHIGRRQLLVCDDRQSSIIAMVIFHNARLGKQKNCRYRGCRQPSKYPTVKDLTDSLSKYDTAKFICHDCMGSTVYPTAALLRFLLARVLIRHKLYSRRRLSSTASKTGGIICSIFQGKFRLRTYINPLFRWGETSIPHTSFTEFSVTKPRSWNTAATLTEIPQKLSSYVPTSESPLNLPSIIYTHTHTKIPVRWAKLHCSPVTWL